MEIVAKITSKGQITIPKEIRDVLGVAVGDSVSFQRRGDVVCIFPRRPGGRFERYRGMGNPGIPKEIDDLDGIVHYVREMRGHTAEDDLDEREFAAENRASLTSK